MMQIVAIVVTHPSDLRDRAQLETVQRMIKDFETSSYRFVRIIIKQGKKKNFVIVKSKQSEINSNFRLIVKIKHIRKVTKRMKVLSSFQQVKFTYTDIPSFLKSDSYWKATIKVNETACEENQPSCIGSFLFTTGFTTLTDALGDVIWQTLLSEVICMGLSFIIFVPDIVSIVAAMFSLLSVNLGVFGFLSLWGVGIDPVSMAALLMSIGFSVDISAHISYHYYEVKASVS
uniref:SSD domain-containing protein n=1 Tax=Heterorhabditis bacteriophora TaxID=37862 RepID=A0A1I7XIU0_HETBA